MKLSYVKLSKHARLEPDSSATSTERGRSLTKDAIRGKSRHDTTESTAQSAHINSEHDF